MAVLNFFDLFRNIFKSGIFVDKIELWAWSYQPKYIDKLFEFLSDFKTAKIAKHIYD
jgi:hypothetical protein